MLRVGAELFTVAFLVAADRDVIQFAVLIQSEAFLPDEEASTVVDQHVFAIRAFAADEKMRKIHSVDVTVQLCRR